jgi:hypothetical protein
VTQLAVTTQAVKAGAAPTRVHYCADGSFLLFDADASEDPSEHDPEKMVVVCAHCLIEQHPAAGRGMDVAQRRGAARYEGGTWVEEPAK